MLLLNTMGHRLGSSLRLDMTVFGEHRLGREAAMGKPVPFLQSDRAVEVCSFYSSFMLLIKMLHFIPNIVHTLQGFYHLDKSNLLDAQLVSSMI